jgi:hypothetical protein
MHDNDTTTTEPYQQLETAIIQLLYEMIDLTVQCRRKMSERNERQVRRSLQLKVWNLWHKIRRFKAQDDSSKHLNRLRATPAGSPHRVVEGKSVVSRPQPVSVKTS